jgi:hypothetical protein
MLLTPCCVLLRFDRQFSCSRDRIHCCLKTVPNPPHSCNGEATPLPNVLPAPTSWLPCSTCGVKQGQGSMNLVSQCSDKPRQLWVAELVASTHPRGSLAPRCPQEHPPLCMLLQAGVASTRV